MPLVWPHKLAPLTIDLRLGERTLSANRSLSGFVQTQEGISDRWLYGMQFSVLRNPLPYRALLAQLRGRAYPVRAPVFDPLRPAINVAGITISGTLGDKTGTVAMAAHPAPKVFVPGMYFNAANDLHILTTISWSGTTATIGFEPAFRRTHSSAAFSLHPFLDCRLMDDAEGAHPLEYGRRTAPAMTLEEYTE